jgi:hypothetical protein
LLSSRLRQRDGVVVYLFGDRGAAESEEDQIGEATDDARKMAAIDKECNEHMLKLGPISICVCGLRLQKPQGQDSQ